MRRFSILLAAGALLSIDARAAEPTTEAKVALTQLKRLVERREADPQLARKMVEGLQKLGFESKEELLGAELASPVVVYDVPLDKLRAYRPGTDRPAELLSPVDSQIYPVTVNRSAKASVFIDQGRLSGYGSPHLTRAIERTRTQLMEKTRLPESAFFLVQIPALNVRLLGHYEDSLPLLRDSVRQSLSKTAATLTPQYSIRPLATPQRSIVPLELARVRRLMLTSIHDVELPADEREGRFVVLEQGVTSDADAVFARLLAPARNLDESVPR